MGHLQKDRGRLVSNILAVPTWLGSEINETCRPSSTAVKQVMVFAGFAGDMRLSYLVHLFMTTTRP